MLIMLLALVTAGGASPTLAPGSHTFDLKHGGRNRSYIVHVPPAAKAGTALPIVLAFHGGGGEAAGFEGYAGLDVVADREGFLVVYPYGTGVLPRRLLTWNAGECCSYAMNQRVDDVGFAIAVLADVAERTPVDSTRTYATGHSNGAMMAYRLAAERADRIVAITAVSGAYDMAQFAPSRPVAILDIHSVDDPRAIYAGGFGPPFPGTTVRSSHRPVMDELRLWVKNNKCNAEPRSAETRTGQLGTKNAGETATLLTWENCASGGAVEHWKLTGVGHGWPGSPRPELGEALIGPPTTLINAAEEAWRFMSKVKR